MSLKSQIIGLSGAVAVGFAAGLYVGISLEFNDAANPLSGPASVYDGDTLTITHGEEKFPVRIYAADAPELRQTCGLGSERVPCGRMARDAVIALIADKDIECEKIEDRDRYGRYVAVCFNHAGVDIGKSLIQQGLALEYSDYSDGRYSGVQSEAQRARRGLWAMDVMPPDQWRVCFTGRIAGRPADCPAQP
ncbi:MAG: thermonuclease family protein [Alphaproteobacteria bacterium]|nr:thermonuclease family protein [Alphaproteobacteria bacterium]